MAGGFAAWQLAPITSVNVPHLLDEITLALICERYHKLPGEVRAEDYVQLMRTWNVQKEIDRVRARQ